MDNQPSNQQNTPPPQPLGNGSMAETSGPIFIPPNQPMTPPKKSHKKRNIIIAAVAVVIVIAAAVITFLLLNQQKPAEHTTTKQPTKTADSAQSIIASINTTLTNKSSKDYQASQIAKTDPMSKSPLTGPSYKVSGANYYVDTTDTYSLTITEQGTTSSSGSVNTAFNTAIISQITSVLRGHSYTQGSTLLAGTEYQSKLVICLVSPANSSPVTVVCSNKSSYQKISNNVKPFYEAYVASPAVGDTSNDVFSSPDIKQSSTDGYQTATVLLSPRQGVSGAVLMFYQTPAGAWQFFTATQNELDCGSYATSDQIAAYAGDKCIDSNGNDSFVGASPTSDSSDSSDQSDSSDDSSTPSPDIDTGSDNAPN